MSTAYAAAATATVAIAIQHTHLAVVVRRLAPARADAKPPHEGGSS